MPAESYAAAAVPGVPLFAPQIDPMTENRRHLDWRRIRATRIDGLLMVPAAIALLLLFHGHPVTVWFLVMAINLSYHFVMETACGQTFGKRWKNLRVVKRDGGPAGASAIAARTVFRIIDAQFIYLVGLITMVITGKRRQRVGDLAAGTIVREDDRPWKPAPSSPLLVIYPVVWIAAALFFGSQLDPKPVTLTNDAYMQQVDRVCEQRMFAEASLTGNASFLQLQQISLQETQAIKNLPPPVTPEAVYGRKVVLKWKRKIDKTAAQIVADARTSNNPRTTLENETPRLIDVMKQAEARMAALGLPHCARL
ncbi:MAG: RDD family protein [Actinobacteria bacterium]|nr:MAG: RDD family protein [Actinomycetota bacterium]